MAGVRFVFLVALALGVAAARGESLSYEGLFDMRGPYEGTDRLGRAFHAVRLGAAGRLPVYACWSSSVAASSCWLGRGWRIPLVESCVFPLREGTLELHLPDGYVRYFHKGRDGRYVGGRFWTAERKENEIRVTADTKDGFPKSVFVYWRGRLVKMECEEGVYEFHHDARNGDTVVCHGKPVLSVRRATSDPGVVRIEAGGARITARLTTARLFLPSTEVSSVPEEAEEPCLSELVFPDGARRTFSYGADGGLARFSTERVTLLWDPSNRNVAAFNDWRFTVGSRPNRASGPRIARVDAAGNRESYLRDVCRGVTEEEFSDGRKVVTRRFTSGDNAGRVRWKEYSANGIVQKRIDYIYDVNGRVCDELVRMERK